MEDLLVPQWEQLVYQMEQNEKFEPMMQLLYQMEQNEKFELMMRNVLEEQGNKDSEEPQED